MAKSSTHQRGSAPQQVERVKNIRTPNFASVYANNVAYSSNFFDMSMTFGEITGVENGVGIVEQSVRVVMSLPHSKLFVMMLFQQLQQYEAQFGQIPMPPLNHLPPEMQTIIKDIGEKIAVHESRES